MAVGMCAVEIGVQDLSIGEDAAWTNIDQSGCTKARSIEICAVANPDDRVRIMGPRSGHAADNHIIAENNASGTPHHESALNAEVAAGRKADATDSKCPSIPIAFSEPPKDIRGVPRRASRTPAAGFLPRVVVWFSMYWHVYQISRHAATFK